MEIKTQPWSVPNNVLGVMAPGTRQEGIRHAPTWPLREVDSDTLAKMCDDYRTEIFRKAGKPDPAKANSDKSTKRKIFLAVVPWDYATAYADVLDTKDEARVWVNENSGANKRYATIREIEL